MKKKIILLFTICFVCILFSGCMIEDASLDPSPCPGITNTMIDKEVNGVTQEEVVETPNTENVTTQPDVEPTPVPTPTPAPVATDNMSGETIVSTPTPAPTPTPVPTPTPTPVVTENGKDEEPTLQPSVPPKPVATPTPQNTGYINLNNYTPVISYGNLSSFEIQVVQALFAEYEKYKRGEVQEVAIVINEVMSLDSYHRVASFFAIHFMIFEYVNSCIDFGIYTDTDKITKTKVSVNIEIFEKCLAERAKTVAKMRTILSGFTEGSELHKLQQIFNWLSKNVSYQVNTLDAYDALFYGQGNCTAYALCFREMAAQLGIYSDLCVGYSNSGKHAWSRVTLSNGEYRYYDVSSYDVTGNAKYLNMISSPWSQYKINNYW